MVDPEKVMISTLKAASTAQNYPWKLTAKEFPLLDVRDAALTDEVRTAVSEYNLNRRK